MLIIYLKKKKFLILILSIVLLVGVIWGGYFLASGKKEKQSHKITQTPEQIQWTTYQDPHGFSISLPSRFKVKVDEWGLIRIGEDPENKRGATAFVMTMIFPEAKSNENILETILPDLKKTFPGFEVTNKRSLEKYQSLVCQIKYTGSEYIGAMLISQKDKNAFLSGLLEEKGEFRKSRPVLLKILSSFKYDHSLQNPTKIAGLIEMIPWKDPNEGAFTLNVPKGWEVKGGLVRPYLDAGVKILATTNDKGIQIENPYPPIYTTPNWALQMGGFTEGSHYNPSAGITQDMIVLSEKSAQDYLKTLLPNYLKLAVAEANSRSDLVSKVPKMPWTTNTTAAEGKLTGDGKVHKVIVIEQGIKMAETGLWAVILVHY